MSKNKNHIDQLTPELIAQYLKGDLSHQKMHEVEKLMLNDDFDAEAMEGYENLEPKEIDSDLDLLKARLVDKVASQKGRSVPLFLKIAASVAFLAISTFIAIQYIDTTSEVKEISQSETSGQSTQEQEQPAPEVADSVKENIEEKPQATESTENDEQIALFQTDKADKKSPGTASGTEISKPEISEEPAELQPIGSYQLDVSDEEVGVSDEEIINYEILQQEAKQDAADMAMSRALAKTKKRAAKQTAEPQTRIMTYQDFTDKPVVGKVTSAEDGSPLPGVNVVVKGTTTGTVTDIDGNYKIKIPEGTDSTLIFSFIGLASLETDITGRSLMDVQMSGDTQQLSEVVVTGYGVEDNTYESTFEAAKPAIGKPAYKNYLEENVRYPANENEKGRVVIKFKVNPNGALSDFEITKSMGEAFDLEAIRLIKEGPKWTPAQRDNLEVEDIVKVRIKFDPEQ